MTVHVEVDRRSARGHFSGEQCPPELRLTTGLVGYRPRPLTPEHVLFAQFACARHRQDSWTEDEHRDYWIAHLRLWPRARQASAEIRAYALRAARARGLTDDDHRLDELLGLDVEHVKRTLRRTHDARRTRECHRGGAPVSTDWPLPRIWAPGDATPDPHGLPCARAPRCRAGARPGRRAHRRSSRRAPTPRHAPRRGARRIDVGGAVALQRVRAAQAAGMEGVGPVGQWVALRPMCDGSVGARSTRVARPLVSEPARRPACPPPVAASAGRTGHGRGTGAAPPSAPERTPRGPTGAPRDAVPVSQTARVYWRSGRSSPVRSGPPEREVAGSNPAGRAPSCRSASGASPPRSPPPERARVRPLRRP